MSRLTVRYVFSSTPSVSAGYNPIWVPQSSCYRHIPICLCIPSRSISSYSLRIAPFFVLFESFENTTNRRKATSITSLTVCSEFSVVSVYKFCYVKNIDGWIVEIYILVMHDSTCFFNKQFFRLILNHGKLWMI